MALPASGALAISQISVELGRASTATTNLNESAVRTLAGVASGAISISNFYGKSSGFALTIASNTNNYNLRSAAVAAGWPGSTDTAITVTLNPGVYVGSGSTGSYAFDVGTPWPAGSTVTLINQGTVVGRGGNGGTGGKGYAIGQQLVGTQITTAGSAGGGGLVTTRATTVTNNGKIAGGGGGGGGGGSAVHKSRTDGGGGGGGAGIGGGSGGTGGTGFYHQGHNAQNGQGSSYTAAGSGGGAGSGWGAGGLRQAGAGGAGGGNGSGGSHGGNGQHDVQNSAQYIPAASGAGGGAAGAAVAGNPFVTYPVVGQRDGSLS
jgi:hypothetical protein